MSQPIIDVESKLVIINERLEASQKELEALRISARQFRLTTEYKIKQLENEVRDLKRGYSSLAIDSD